MAELKRLLQQHSILGQEMTVGAYRRETFTGKRWAIFRLQAAGTAGVFVSPEYLAKQLGSEVVEYLRAAVIGGLGKMPPARPPNFMQYDVGTYGRGPVGSVGALRSMGFKKPAFQFPVQTGAFATSGAKFAGGFTVSGQYGQAMITMQRGADFEQYGALLIREEVNRTEHQFIQKLILELKKIAVGVVIERVYNNPAQVVRRRGMSLQKALKSRARLARFFAEKQATGTLAAAVEAGIYTLYGANVINIGIDYELLKENSGVDYTIFIEHGHRVVLPGGIETGSFVLGRPFKDEIFKKIGEYMRALTAEIRRKNIGKVIGDTVFSWITNVRGEVDVAWKGEKEFIGPSRTLFESTVKTPIGEKWY